MRRKSAAIFFQELLSARGRREAAQGLPVELTQRREFRFFALRVPLQQNGRAIGDASQGRLARITVGSDDQSPPHEVFQRQRALVRYGVVHLGQDVEAGIRGRVAVRRQNAFGEARILPHEFQHVAMADTVAGDEMFVHVRGNTGRRELPQRKRRVLLGGLGESRRIDEGLTMRVAALASRR